ncbi:hypothetical protein [Alteribacter natronophilus]|uniref:hypothetical protein n=1 Tax=Alteribacter natronophilus TaxID=2583810 RepID=UPI00110E612A|nr:hypothetical protein [Alteribacter natronophilus]TMW70905.1 hypothetical protein FGB90_13055 [Alteribacter natronophilus]
METGQILTQENLPKPRDWEAKVFAVPNIPRGKEGFPKSLKIILEQLIKNTPYNTTVKIPGSESFNTLEGLCIKLRPSGIVTKNSAGWNLSPEAKLWLETEDPYYLTALLTAKIRFFAEMLAVLLDDPKKASELQSIANKEYLLNWKTNTEIRARIGWLTDLGMISHQDYTQKYSITEAGKRLLEKVQYTKPSSFTLDTDPTSSETSIPLSNWALKLTSLNQDELTERKTSFGYFPGSNTSVKATVDDYLLMMNTPVELTHILKYSLESYGIAETSTKSFLYNLDFLDLIDRKSKTVYQTNNLGKKLTESSYELDFACIINKKYTFVFEILPHLKESSLSTKQLAVIAKVSYGFRNENKSDINKRLSILRNAELIQDMPSNNFSLTHRGQLLLDQIKDEEYMRVGKHLKNSNEETKQNSQETTNVIDKVLNDLRLTSSDSSNPDGFEKTLCDCFKILGFNAKWLGGSGKTDVLLQAPTTPRFAYSVALDAKTTYSGGITESQINFDTLKDHKKIHGANYSAVVAREFQGERLINRAKQHEVALINIDTLERLIRWHDEVPLKSDSYKKVFMQKGLVSLNVIEKDRNAVIREGSLLQAVLKCLSEESNDPITEGIIQPREIYHLLKNQNQFDTPPTLEEINTMLKFLSSPLVGCVSSTKEGYFALGSLDDAAQKFDFYLKACSQVK